MIYACKSDVSDFRFCGAKYVSIETLVIVLKSSSTVPSYSEDINKMQPEMGYFHKVLFTPSHISSPQIKRFHSFGKQNNRK